MASDSSPRNRGCNTGIRFDLSQFTERLFATVGAKACFKGPGPAELSWVSAHSTRAERFAVTYLAEELFSKFDDGLPSSEKRLVAISKFEEGEISCALTNFKFQPNQAGQPPVWLEAPEMLPEGYDPSDGAVFRLAKRHISRVLGDFPGWETIVGLADHGPGATTRLSRRDSHRSNKWAGRPHCTTSLSSSLEILLKDWPLVSARLGLEGSLGEITQGNKLDWVPKNYKTDRTIAIEPDWNMFLQKGLGAFFRRRLKRHRQDLDDQENNKFLAALGSITGELATLDLSAASDSISYRLVEYLLNPDWMAALELVRSPVGFYSHGSGKSREVRAVIYEKFSSMGNGVTFELESLIFWAILRAVSDLSGETDHRLYVYGDDIIVPSGMAGLAMMYLNKAGFVVNQKKSFWSGPFRESCGGHYFSGDDVTPIYVREPVDTIDRLFLLHNNVWRWFLQFPGICDPESVRDLLRWIRGHAPVNWQKPRLLRADVGDGAFIGSFDEVCPSSVGKTKRRAGWEGWRVETLQYRKKRPKPREGSTAKPHLQHFPAGSGPDLASLWKLERSSAWRAERYFQRGKDRSWQKSVDFLDRLFPTGMSEDDIPYAERWWYVAVQVLPFEPGDSWWFC